MICFFFAGSSTPLGFGEQELEERKEKGESRKRSSVCESVCPRKVSSLMQTQNVLWNVLHKNFLDYIRLLQTWPVIGWVTLLATEGCVLTFGSPAQKSGPPRTTGAGPGKERQEQQQHFRTKFLQDQAPEEEISWPLSLITGSEPEQEHLLNYKLMITAVWHMHKKGKELNIHGPVKTFFYQVDPVGGGRVARHLRNSYLFIHGETRQRTEAWRREEDTKPILQSGPHGVKVSMGNT